MNELIKVTERGGEQLVSARELHEFLEIGKDFSTWFKDRVEKYGFEEGLDFSPILGNLTESMGRPRKEYIIKLDMAKELSMVEGNEKGSQARKYFIACERKLKEITTPKLPQTYAEALLEAGRLALELEQAKPKVEYYDKVLDTSSEFTTTQIAKELSMTARHLNDVLKLEKVQFKQNNQWLLYKEYQNKGYTKTRTTIYFDSHGEEQSKHSTVWTERGRQFIHDLVEDL